MENTDDILKKEIIHIIREEIGWTDNGCVINDETKLIEEANLDSMMIVQLIVAIEEKFQIEFNDSEDLLNSMKDLHSLIEYTKKSMAN